MKRLMVTAFAAAFAVGVYAQCGDSCNTYDFKAALTKPIGKAAIAGSCDDCGYRTKATGSLNGWLVMCSCDDVALVVVIDKEKKAYVTTRMGMVLLNQMGKPTRDLEYGAEVEAAFGFTLCDLKWCWAEQTVGLPLPINPTEPQWAVALAGFGTIKSQAKLNLPDLITAMSGTLVGVKPGPGIEVSCADAICTCVCPLCDQPTDFLDAVSGTWTLKYNAKATVDPNLAIGTALKRLGVTTVVVDCESYDFADWDGLVLAPAI
jgi:hypothetical protein